MEHKTCEIHLRPLQTSLAPVILHGHRVYPDGYGDALKSVFPHSNEVIRRYYDAPADFPKFADGVFFCPECRVARHQWFAAMGEDVYTFYPFPLLFVEQVGPNRVQVIRTIRDFIHVNLVEAKALTESPKQFFSDEIPKHTLELKEELERWGAVIRVEWIDG